MTKAQARRHTKHKAKYALQFARTTRNKRRRLERYVKKHPGNKGAAELLKRA